MRKRLSRCSGMAFFGFLLASNQAIGAPQIHTISKSEVRSGSPAVTHARLKDVVWDLFDPQDYRTKKPPTRSLGHLFLETKTQGTHVPGLCRYDSVEVDFAPVTPNEKGPSVPSKAVGLRSTSHFRFSNSARQGLRGPRSGHSGLGRAMRPRIKGAAVLHSRERKRGDECVPDMVAPARCDER